jgi:hypothetical protein
MRSIVKVGRFDWAWRGVMNVSSEQASQVVRHALKVLGPERIKPSGTNALAMRKGIPIYGSYILVAEWQQEGRRQTTVTITVRGAGLMTYPGFEAIGVLYLYPFLRRSIRLVVDDLRESGLVLN